MPLGEIFLSAFLQVLFDRLSSPELLKFAFREGIRSKLTKWDKTLKVIQALLIDAEEKQLTDRAVKIWLDDLRDLAYDVEDILDEFATEASLRKLKADGHRTSTSTVSSSVPHCFTGLNPYAVNFNMSTGSKIKETTSRLDEICMRREKLGLKELAGSTTSTAASERPPSTSVPTEPAVYGRDEDKATILKKLLNTEASRNTNFHVIPIVGMGGIGKTTLAREVYNDEAVEGFYPKAWVCVSDDSIVLRISKAILESITRMSCDLSNLDVVQNKLKEAVTEKKFLLVLDDVWKMNYGLWESLKSPFMTGAPGSVIIVTTRNIEVASTVSGPNKYHELKTLSDDDCWSLFMTHASGGRDIGARRNDLKLIREKVVEKCSGLPLAARTLGGLLHSKMEEEWEDILNSKIWNLSGEDEVLPVLKLSYHYLPAPLKRCFAYSAIFPKDYEFEQEELVLLWMAEGLIQQSRDEQSRNKKQLEDVGSTYFHNLLSRSIFQRSDTDSFKFTMHDLVHDLAELVSSGIRFRLEDQSKIFIRARHSSYTRSYYERKDRFEVYSHVKHLRTFLPLSPADFRPSFVANAAVFDLLPKLKKLRVLSLKGYLITVLPNSVGSLRHLTYLNLSNTEIKSLPESITSLLNLQILILTDCSHLLMLPSHMRNLIQLQYLDISGANGIREMPTGMKELKSLFRLSNFIVSKETGSSLKDLKYLECLCGELCISSLENAVDFQDRAEIILIDKKDLQVLRLEWGLAFDNSRNAVVEENVLINMLQPHRNLKELTIIGYGGTRFPSWLGDPSFSNMVGLTLEHCANCTYLPALGLLGSLKNLTVRGIEKLKRIDLEVFGEGCSKPFQSLETICFGDMKEWEHWEPIEETENVQVFPRLRELSILECPKLNGKLPDHLPSLQKLVISGCRELVISFSSLPMLCELDIKGCKHMAWSSPMDSESLNSMSLSNISVTGNWLREGFQKVEILKIANCEEFVYLWKNQSFLKKPPLLLPGFNSIKKLYIRGCNALTSMPNEIQNKAGLEELEIVDCDALQYIIRGQPSPSLKKLVIRKCEKLTCLFDDEHVDDIRASSSSCPSSSSVEHMDNVDNTDTSLLEYLSVSECPALICLSSRGQLPATLTHLFICRCSNLKNLVSGGQLPEALKSLEIYNCPILEEIVELCNNPSLEQIHIQQCERLKSIPERLHTLRNLRKFCLIDSPSVVSFPQGGLPDTISAVSIVRCEQLKAFPDRMHSLNCLRQLTTLGCPSIASFPEEVLPTNLTHLNIKGLNIYIPLIRCVGLGRLTSLEYLNISECPDVVSFPPEERGMALPSSLTKLTILRFPNLKHLSSKGFQDLNSLVCLFIGDCPNLTSLPTLPSSLELLYIKDCPLIKKRWKRGKGSDWSKIRDIPCVKIDGRSIYDSEEAE